VNKYRKKGEVSEVRIHVGKRRKIGGGKWGRG